MDEMMSLKHSHIHTLTSLHITGNKQYMKRIILAVTNDLATDQRVDRTCRALTEAGWEVTLVGRKLRNSLPLEDRPYTTHRMRLIFRRSALFYAEYNLRLFLLLLFSKADCLFANDTDTLAACGLASRIRRKPLVFDAHELFPEVPELEGRPRVKAFWEWVERVSLPYAKCCFTVCQSVADEYRRRYGVEMTVVRNVPDRPAMPPQKPSHDADRQPILLYQGAVNIGRGIHELADAMGHLPECRLIVAGDGDLLHQEQAYASTLPWNDRIQFLGRVAPSRLHSLTAKATLGLCLLEDLGLNYRYSLPNRIADFANAGVPVLATDFPEIRRVLEEYGTGTLTGPLPHEQSGGDYRHYITRLSEEIQAALHHWENMPADERERRFARAGEELNWQHEKYKLINAIHTLEPSR